MTSKKKKKGSILLLLTIGTNDPFWFPLSGRFGLRFFYSFFHHEVTDGKRGKASLRALIFTTFGGITDPRRKTFIDAI